MKQEETREQEEATKRPAWCLDAVYNRIASWSFADATPIWYGIIILALMAPFSPTRVDD